MTLEQLREAVLLETQKIKSLVSAVSNAQGFLYRVRSIVSPDNEFIDLIFPDEAHVDAFVAQQAALYASYLTAIEDAADVIGTDPFGSK